ncbi:acetyl/propionyl/methylcrotonyl-CoA carboxylase subunit alpha [Roseiflexus sp.]|uniref:acetyl-CoA carboxylase biotin carboxylase subunit n=1 Tax=Roseiflexus sp. TaxID=2562120 RepID=UPI00398AF14E
MFRTILVANRGEIAVRIIRTCRDMGIRTVALYDNSDLSSLHVRLADECVQLSSGALYHDAAAIVQIARDHNADAIHPGYGFLAEHSAFARACEDAGITFIGPSSTTLEKVRDKIATLETVRAAGIAVPRHSPHAYRASEWEALRDAAERLGYPLVLKAYSGGRSHGTRLVREPAQLESMAQHAHSAALTAFGDERLYLEEAFLPAHYLEVQIVGDRHGNLIHLGERDGSIQHNHRKVVEESPAPYLTDAQRKELWRQALAIGRLLGCVSTCTVEFVLDSQGRFYFTEVKARIQVEHPITEMRTGIDLVRTQIQIAAGEPLGLSQDDVALRGCAIQVRVNAEDPWNHYLPSPGHLRRFRFPGGPGVRVDTYAYGGCDVPVRYDPLLAKVVAWDDTRAGALGRLRRAVADFAISGVQTNLPLIQRILDAPEFTAGTYDSEFTRRPLPGAEVPPEHLRNLAIAAALAYIRRGIDSSGALPDRAHSGWHRDSRKLPQ